MADNLVYYSAFVFAAYYEGYSGYGGYFLRFQFCVASGDEQEGSRIVFYEPVDGLPAFVVCHFRDGASVDYADVGAFSFSRGACAELLQFLLYGCRLCKVQFTAQCEVCCRFPV